MLRLSRLLLAVSAFALLAPAGAYAQDSIDGDVLDVHADGKGRFQVMVEGRGGAFAPGTPATPAAGLNLALYTSDFVPGPLFGFLGPGHDANSGEFIPVAPPQRDAPAPGEVRLRSTYRTPAVQSYAEMGIVVTESLFYRQGETQIRARYELRNQSTSVDSHVRASLVGDLFHRDSSVGAGFFAAGPPRAVGGVNEEKGTAVAVEDSVAPTPFTRYEADDVATIFGRVRDPGSIGFDNAAAAGPFDDAVGVQWDFRGSDALQEQPGVTVIEVIWRFPGFEALLLTPERADRTVGETHTIEVVTSNGGTAPLAGRLVRWGVEGANPGSGSTVTDDRGRAEIPLVATSPGADTLFVYVDGNGDGIRQENEPLRTATVEWQAATLPPPRRGVSVNVEPVRGRVRVAEPVASPGQRPRGVRSAAVGPFRTLARPEQIPVGSVLDTTRGTVRLTSARDRLGALTQTSNFKRGRFKVRQSRRRPLTTMRMRGGKRNACPSSRRSASTARRVIRRLRGSGRGRFRTRGRHSSATVRGTVWTVTDTCAGTVTTVKRGSVKVRDFRRGRTVTVREGGRYLARARR